MIISLLIPVSLLSCTSQDEESFPHQYDILAELFAQPLEATEHIEFVNPQDAYHLFRGWSVAEKETRWANATTAQLYFYHDGSEKSKEVEVIWRALPSSEEKKQRTKIFLNGKKITSLTIKTPFKTNRFRLPASALYPGFNLLTFQFSYTETPVRLDPDSQDTRNLAVAFEKIRFISESSNTEPIVYQLEAQAFAQKANSGVAIFKKLPASFDLDVQYQASKGTKASIEVIDEQGKRQTLSLPSGKTARSRRFTFPEQGFYRIHALTTGENDGTIVWEKVFVSTKTEQVTLEQPSQSFVKRPKVAEKKADILLYVIDTLRSDHVGCYGYSRNTTPYIDAFAKENTLYPNAYATSSWTKPSGASIMTGLLPRNHRTSSRNAKLPEEVVTLAESLQKHGYYTAAFITNGSLADYFGFAQGFDKFIYFQENHSSRMVHTPSAEVNKQVFKFLREYLAQPERKPLFLLFWSTDPHSPYAPPQDVLEIFDIQQYTPIKTDLKLLTEVRHAGLEPTASQIEFMKARYDQEIFANDRSFGELVEELKTLGLYQGMTIILTADHGDEFFEHGGVGHAFTLYNDQIRVPLVVKAPEIESGSYHHAVQIIDIYPTILDSLGIDEPYPLDGISLMRPINGQRVLYFENNFAGNDLVSRLDDSKKIIVNKQYFRPPLTTFLPVYEAYAAEDLYEQQPLEIEGFENFARIHEIASYINRKNVLDLQEQEVEISPELDQKLRELGYAK